MNRLELRERILECTECDLHAKTRGPVPFSGPVPATYAIVGEAPGAEEDKGGEPFVGRAGQLLRKHLIESGLDPAQAFICNSVSCFPNGTPRPGSVAACRQNLWDQLTLSQAPLILTLGSIAMNAFRPDLRMTMAHGQTFSIDGGRTVFAGFHPAAALRRPDWHDAFTEDLKRFGQAVIQGSWAGLTIDLCAYCRTPEDDMEEITFDKAGLPFCEKCWPTSPDGRAESHPPSPAPSQSASQAEPTLSAAEQIALVKDAFPGTVVVKK